MQRALRNLIAFVFLGGIFWFAYRDLDKLWEPRFQLTVGGLVAIFAVFWLLVPVLVVRMRIARRVAQNRRAYDEWVKDGKEDGGARTRRSRLPLEVGENELFHEKGTLYVGRDAGLEALSVACKIGDVAFPRERRNWRKIQRVHFYLTDRHVFFFGKEINFKIGLGEIMSYRTTPGGIVFEMGRDAALSGTVCFTFQNPLITADQLDLARTSCRSKK